MPETNIFKDKTVLITGGTGFLGTELIKEILKLDPKSIRVFSRDEVKHHETQEFFNYNPKLRNLIGDVRDYERVKTATKGCDIVIHAAALKRLDILEYNVNESIYTNIMGTVNVAQACIENRVEKAIYISTDKACMPANTYGACKFVSERIFIENNYSKGTKNPIFTVVRYGNVLNSTGSVIPFFENKIKNNETIPLTDKRMTRFIISPSQAVKLVFDALKYGEGGEVFVPILPSFRIVDLIEALKKAHKSNTKVKLVGIRPGEKIHEMMINSTETSRTFQFKDMYVIASHLEENHEYLRSALKVSGMKEYSSNDSLLAQGGILPLLNKYNILNLVEG